jgi:hypothetical protein
MTDPASHPAFLAADFAAAFTSATTGHAFSSGLSNCSLARRFHDVQGFFLGETITYNRLLARPQEVSWHGNSRTVVWVSLHAAKRGLEARLFLPIHFWAFADLSPSRFLSGRS